MTPDEAFCRDIPETKQDDVMLMISEAASGWADHDCITILDRDRIDAINVRACGTIRLGDVEHWFLVRNGNHDGTVLEGWDYHGVQNLEYHRPTQWVLQPQRRLINQAIAEGRGPFLVMKWDAMLKNHKDIAEIPGKYGYDRHFQPGSKVETHWRDKAAKHHFDIVDKETADETRKRLTEANEPFDVI